MSRATPTRASWRRTPRTPAAGLGYFTPAPSSGPSSTARPPCPRRDCRRPLPRHRRLPPRRSRPRRRRSPQPDLDQRRHPARRPPRVEPADARPLRHEPSFPRAPAPPRTRPRPCITPPPLPSPCPHRRQPPRRPLATASDLVLTNPPLRPQVERPPGRGGEQEREALDGGPRRLLARVTSSSTSFQHIKMLEDQRLRCRRRPSRQRLSRGVTRFCLLQFSTRRRSTLPPPPNRYLYAQGASPTSFQEARQPPHPPDHPLDLRISATTSTSHPLLFNPQASDSTTSSSATTLLTATTAAPPIP